MYQEVRNDNGLLAGVANANGDFIPANSDNTDYQTFLVWYAVQVPPPFSLDPMLPELWLPLIDELAGEAYVSLSDVEAADALNARDKRGLAPLWEVDLYRVRNGLTIPLENAKASHASSDVRNAAAAALAYLSSPHVQNLDLDDPDSAAMLLALEVGEVISTDQLQAIDALANNRASRCEQLGLPPASASIVARARAFGPPP